MPHSKRKRPCERREQVDIWEVQTTPSASGRGGGGRARLRIVDLLTEMLKGFSQERSEVAWYSTHIKHIHNLPGLRGVRNGCQLRIYGFTDLAPSLPLPLADPFTRIPESSRRRYVHYAALCPDSCMCPLARPCLVFQFEVFCCFCVLVSSWPLSAGGLKSSYCFQGRRSVALC